MAGTDRIKPLRAAMQQEGITAYLVPSNDAFMSEYVPACYQRLHWLTGFDGSAGAAIVHRKQLAFFTDGRYTLQAKQQVKGFTIHNIAETRPVQWAEQHLGKHDVLGYDPWLHTPKQLEAWQEAAKNAGFTLTPVNNLIDALWQDQPAPSEAPVVPHPLKYAGKNSAAKRKTILKELQEEALLITAPDSICWLLNIRGGDVPHTPLLLAYALMRKDGKITLYYDAHKVPAKTQKHLGSEVTIAPIGQLPKDLKAIQQPIRLDPASCPAALYQAVKQPIAKDDPCQLPKAVKNTTEIEGMRAAHIRDGAALTSFLYWVASRYNKEKITELDCVEKLQSLRQAQELYVEDSFDAITGYGAHGAIIHYRVTPKTSVQLKAGSLFLLDSGGQYLDGTTDVTRTVALGKPTKEQRHAFTRVLKGHIALARAVFPEGTTGADLDVLARHALWEAGLDYQHGTGHGVGSYLGVHEGPQGISKRNHVKLQPGMVLSNEPGYYKAGEYGIRIESLVLVTKSEHKGYLQFETLTQAPIDMTLIEASLLTQAEKAWLDAYHQQVMQTIGKLLDEDARRWLERVL